jgi:hypothetical protein
MSNDPQGFHIGATLRAGNLSEATRALLDATRAAPEAPALVDWRDADDRVHDSAEDVPVDQRSVGLTFAGEAAFGVLEVKDDGTFGLGAQHVIAGRSEDVQRAALRGWAQVFRALVRQGALLGARVTRQAGGKCAPHVPLAAIATHVVVWPVQEIERAYADPEAFFRAWDSVETHDDMRLCIRGLDALANPAFLARVLPGQMAMARAARPGLTRFYDPVFEPGEREILEAGEPTLSGVGYYAGPQIYEFAGHTLRGTELRCIDLFVAWRIAAIGEVPGGGPVREVRAVFMDEEQATRGAKLLQEAGVAVYWEDTEGQLRRVPSVIP